MVQTNCHSIQRLNNLEHMISPWVDWKAKVRQNEMPSSIVKFLPISESNASTAQLTRSQKREAILDSFQPARTIQDSSHLPMSSHLACGHQTNNVDSLADVLLFVSYSSITPFLLQFQNVNS